MHTFVHYNIFKIFNFDSFIAEQPGIMSILLEARPYRPFKSSEEYLIAMKEDLAEWLNALYPELRMNPDNFMDRLDTGVAICKVSVMYNTIGVAFSIKIYPNNLLCS